MSVGYVTCCPKIQMKKLVIGWDQTPSTYWADVLTTAPPVTFCALQSHHVTYMISNHVGHVMRGHASQNENYDNSSVSQHKVQSLNSNWVLYKLVYTYFYLRLKHSSSYHFKGVFKCIPIFSLFFLTHIYTAYNSRSNNYTNLFNLASFTLHLTSDGERLQPETHRLLN